MKKLIGTLLAMFVLLSTFNVIASNYGDGTEESPILITTQEELLLISDFPDCYFELGNDIVLEGDWTPLCTYSEAFTGTLDGKGHTISNLTVKNFLNSGLFATNSGTIKNLNVETSETGINFTKSTKETANIGIFAAVNNGTVSNCSATEKVGYDNSYYNGSSSGSSYSVYIGGICGVNSGTIINATTSVSAKDINAYGSYSSSFSTYRSYGTIYSGGISGKNLGIIEKCSSTSEFSEKEAYTSYFGGIAGESSNKINDSYFVGNFSGGYIGGIVGKGSSAEINNCYAVMNGTATTKRGIIGSVSSATVTNSFYDQTVSGATDTTYGTPKSTLAMKMKRTYTNAGWDFDNIWGIDSSINNGYPYLLFEYPQNGVSFDKSAQKTTVSVEADGEYTVIFADFDGTALAKAEAETVTLSKGENDVETPFALSDGDKIFLWNNLLSVAPLCLPEIIGD